MEWKTNDVATRTTMTGEVLVSVRVPSDAVCSSKHERQTHWHSGNGKWDRSEKDDQYRPLVVLDPESDEDALRLYNATLGSTYTRLPPQLKDRMKRRIEKLLLPLPPKKCEAAIVVNGTTLCCGLDSHGTETSHKITGLDVSW